jgi:muramoyltetrapeptide carboxypeptidase
MIRDVCVTFKKRLNNPDIKAIFCGRGGYGTVRIIDKLDFSAFLKNPKWIIGFSDVTYLHSLLNNQLYVQSLHAAMPSTYATTDTEAIDAIRKALFGEHFEYPIISNPNNRKGTMEGTVIGGNLSILYSITGTRSGFDTSGKILFIEDLDEYIYHIDRMLINLKRSGKLDKLAGLFVGGMSDLKDHDIPFGQTVEEMVLEHCADSTFPIMFDFPAGSYR